MVNAASAVKKTVQPIDPSFGLVSEVGPRIRALDRSIYNPHYRHLANTVERLCAAAVRELVCPQGWRRGLFLIYFVISR